MVADFVRRLIAHHTGFCGFPEGVDPWDALDPGLPLEQRPTWYLWGTRALIALGVMCFTAAVIAAVFEYV